MNVFLHGVDWILGGARVPRPQLHDVWDLPCSDCRRARRAPWAPHRELRLGLPRAPRTTGGRSCLSCRSEPWKQPFKLYCPRSLRTTWGQPRDRPHLSLGQVSKIWLLLSIHHSIIPILLKRKPRLKKPNDFCLIKNTAEAGKDDEL